VSAGVRIEPWGTHDKHVLEGCLGDPAMMTHLGGVEPPEKIAERQARYEQPGSGQFKIVADGEPAGWVGHWDKDWRDEVVYEIGWAVLPPFQGRGLAGQATAALLDVLRADAKHRYVHAFPGVENGPSNGICRKLGFTLLEALEFEYPPGQMMACNDWRLDLRSDGAPPS
jgi:RimJ/RimL family protein N-acetyltransferase